MDRLARLLERRSGVWGISVALGLANAVALLGWQPIDPTFTTWIYGDNATYFYAWDTFRRDPHLHFPLGWTERIGYPIGTSIALLDAIPLVAILLRPLSPLLPQTFQYLGLFSALCFVLQAYFALSLCRRLFPSRPLFVAFGSLFFMLSAPLTWRAFGHTALLSHWLVLAALDSYFRDPSDRPHRWMARLWVVLFIAGGITPYMAAMCFFIALAGVGRLLLDRRYHWIAASIAAAATFAVMVASLTIFGVIVARDAATYWAPGYGYFSFNLNSLVNPLEYGSILLPQLPVISPAQVEGYNYLGLGVIALVVLGLIRRPRAILWMFQRRFIPLVVLAVGCTALAVSAKVTFGATTLLDIPVPDALLGPLNGLRASGRLFWPVYYLITIAALSLTFWSWKSPVASTILGLALLVQWADMQPLRSKVREVVDKRYPSSLASPRWEEVSREVDNLILIPAFQCGPYTAVGGADNYVWFGLWASAHRLRSNNYYAARVTKAELQGHCVDIMREQLDGKLDARSAYLVTDAVKTVWGLRGVTSHRCEVVDGFNLCVPGPSGPSTVGVPPAAPYELGTTVELKSNDGPGRQYLTLGWGESNPHGTWSEGPVSIIRLGRQGDPRPMALALDTTAFVARGHPRLDVDVVVNGVRVDQWILRSLRPVSVRRARIPADVIARRPSVDIELRFQNPEAPLFIGAGPSTQFLGLNVRWLQLYAE